MTINNRVLANIARLLSSMEPGATAVVRGVLMTRSRNGERFTFFGHSWSTDQAALYLASR